MNIFFSKQAEENLIKYLNKFQIFLNKFLNKF